MEPYDAFALTLQVNSACNLRCAYCYTGAKTSRPMPAPVARAAIDRAAASLRAGGLLEVGFFGGEPLIESRLIAELIDYASDRARARGVRFSASLTTNGTVGGPAAWAVLTDPRVEVSLSHDGLPAVHDRHRDGTSAAVEASLRRLLEAGRDVNMVMVVRPDTADALSDGLRHLFGLGARRIEFSLDLWTRWSTDDLDRLGRSLAICADLWRESLPDLGVSVFDENLLRFAGAPADSGARCGFGRGQIAVAPSGRLYPCERLIGEDRGGALEGHAQNGADFLFGRREPAGCPCSNQIRTGCPETPDFLLNSFDEICARETRRVLGLERSPNAG